MNAALDATAVPVAPRDPLAPGRPADAGVSAGTGGGTGAADAAPAADAAHADDAVTDVDHALDDVDYGADLVAALVAVIKRIGALRSRVSATGDYDISQTHVLIRIAEHGPARAVELAEQVCADTSTVSRQVAALVRAGLVERRADPDDGRASLLVATAAGLADIAWHRRMRGSVFGPLVAGWTDDERATFLRLLTDLTRGLDSHREAIVTALLAAHPDRSM